MSAEPVLSVLDAACWYAGLRLHSFPVEPRGKAPIGELVPNGKDDATVDLPTLDRWFRGANGRTPNIGIACGPSDLVVIDIDPRNGGEATFAALELELGLLPPTWTADTGGGGVHMPFRAPAGGALVGKLGPGVDLIRNGYIVAPPSVHPSGGIYSWRTGHGPSDVALAELPPRWLARATRRPAEPAKTPKASRRDDERTIKRARKYLERMEPAIQGQNGSGALFAAVCRMMHGFDLDDGAVRSLIVEDYNPRCDPPWSDREVDHKIREAREKVDADRWRVEDRERVTGTRAAPVSSGSSAVQAGDDDAPSAGKRRGPLLVEGGALSVAERFVAEFAAHPDGITLRRWRGDWYRWSVDQGHYAHVSDEALEASLYRDGKLGRRQDVSDVRHAMIAVGIGGDDVLIDGAELGAWLGAATVAHHPLDVAPCRNGLLHLPTRTLVPASPRYFATTALGVAYDPKVQACSRWLAFLGAIWTDDPQSIDALQEWFGYLLTADTRQQKILLVVGPKRSGKGTIMRVLTELLGRASVAAPTLASLGSNFGLWPLIGRTAAIIGDARLGGRSDIAQIVERLLSVSGQDPQTIDRKHREPWTGYLSARITIVSNELPRFTDASDALASRMLILELARSWYGQEDVGLTDALLAELPGILAWAIEGWHRLRARGHFVQPASSADTAAELSDLASPVSAWVRERCDVGSDRTLLCDEAYVDFKAWCKANGHDHVPTLTTFGRDIKAVTGASRKRESGGSRSRFYAGLELKR